MIKIQAISATILLGLAQAGWCNETDKPSCEKLEALYITLAEKSGEEVNEAEVKEAVYGENPSDADCALMLSLFPVSQ